ncbi:MAG: DUF1848 domain-containing protein [Schwartzia sp. (in: firmicutes)]
MIVSASRRTDIPAFYFDWFCQRLREGYVDVANPFNRRQVSRISLLPDAVDCIVFWTKDPARMLGDLSALTSYPYYVQVSLTPYGKDIEENLRPKRDIVKTVQALSLRLGRARVVWRYDPILLNDRYTIDRHLTWFEQTLTALSPSVERCVISFIDLYAKVQRKATERNLHALSEGEIHALSAGLSNIAKGSGVTLQTCAEEMELEAYGIAHGACIDGALIARLTGKAVRVGKAKSQRPLCRCVDSFDIGQYDTCIHGCCYCYANDSLEQARQGFRGHDRRSSLLTGRLLGDERITIHER